MNNLEIYNDDLLIPGNILALQDIERILSNTRYAYVCECINYQKKKHTCTSRNNFLAKHLARTVGRKLSIDKIKISKSSKNRE